MSSNHEYTTGSTDKYPKSPYEQLEAYIPYVIDTEPPYDGRAAKDAYTCAFIHAGPITDPSKYGEGEDGSTFAVINVSYLQKRVFKEEDGTRKEFRIYNNTPIETDADLILVGPNFGEAYSIGWTPINTGQSITVGREDEVTRKLFPLSPEVSRNHFTLTYQDNRLSITDNGSSNGTHVWTAESTKPQPPDPLEQEYGHILGDDTRQRIIRQVGELAGEDFSRQKVLDRRVERVFHPDVRNSEVPEDASASRAEEMVNKHRAEYYAAQDIAKQYGGGQKK